MRKRAYQKAHPKEFRDEVVQLVKVSERSVREVAEEFDRRSRGSRARAPRAASIFANRLSRSASARARGAPIGMTGPFNVRSAIPVQVRQFLIRDRRLTNHGCSATET